VYGDTVPEEEIEALAQAHYGHLLQLLGEFIHHRFMSAERKASLVRVENYEAFVAPGTKARAC
jgi:lauroyl/myristoyl acyltransferase